MENNFFYLGEDLGMGANKLYGSSGGLQFLSQVAMNGSQHLSGVIGLRQLLRPLEIKTQHGSFYTGEGAHDYGRPVENLDFDRLTGSPEMMALFYGSITRYQQQHGAITQPIVMMGGLPLQMMSGDTAKEYANQVRARFKGTHQWLADGKAEQIQIAEVKLIPQPVAALFDYVLDDKGKFIPEYAGLLKQEVGILSVGFNTLELLVVRDRAPVERFTAGQTVGVRRLLELVNDQEHVFAWRIGFISARRAIGHRQCTAGLGTRSEWRDRKTMGHGIQALRACDRGGRRCLASERTSHTPVQRQGSAAG